MWKLEQKPSRKVNLLCECVLCTRRGIESGAKYATDYSEYLTTSVHGSLHWTFFYAHFVIQSFVVVVILLVLMNINNKLLQIKTSRLILKGALIC